MSGISIFDQTFQPQVPTYKWRGASGTIYALNVHGLSQSFRDVPAIYIIAKYWGPGVWTALYVGQTDSLSRRIAEHRDGRDGKLRSAINLGATGIHAMVASPSESERLRVELDLIRGLKPALNEIGLPSFGSKF
jgi:predicted GIY-YIG superfamily endonuclease